MPRIGSGHPGADRRRRRFNGASASMPRIAAPTSVPTTALRSLQRGLGIDAEDRSQSVFDGSSNSPGFNGASASMPRIDGPPAQGRRGHCRFNGASASMPRIGRTWAAGRRRPPRFNGASASMPRIGRAEEAGPATVRGASTGPRHRCRGSSKEPGTLRGRLMALQRGLGIDAEDRGRASAALDMAAVASTGPRHRCRGSARSRSGARPGGLCFNGASASMPRIGRSAWPVRSCSWQLQRGLGIDAEDRRGRR